MYKNSFLLCFLFLFPVTILLGQPVLSGKVIGEGGEPLLGATVLVLGTELGTVSDDQGHFQFARVPLGDYRLGVSFLGYEGQVIPVRLQKSKPVFLTIVLKEDDQVLDAVVVQGKSVEQQRREAPIRTEVIDTKRLQAQSVSLPQVINQTSGVRVRQTGGIGSRTSVNINGLQGNAIRFFRDGIPLDYLGRAFNLSLVPIDQLSGIEIYKGVLPVELGADALGGAVNFISKKEYKNNLDFSYGLGSFNTHQATLNGYLNLPNSKLFTSVSSYFIHSDNNYTIQVEVPDPNTGVLVEKEVERFHDGIQSLFIEAKLGIRDVKMADLFEVGISDFDLQKELQHNIRLTDPYGEAENEEKSVTVTTRYQKQFGRLYLNVFGAYGQRKTLFDDTPEYRYDWLGKATPVQDNDPGGETDRTVQSFRKFDFDNRVVRMSLAYQVHENHRLNLNHNYIDEQRTGSDPLAESSGTGVDVLTFPAKYTRNITGIGLASSFFNNKLDHVLAFKRYGVTTSSITSSVMYYGHVPELSDDSYGVAHAMKYHFSGDRYVRFSYERATRIPESQEYFGDALFITGNPDLIPETSDNLNLSYYTPLNESRTLGLEVNSFYRRVKNNIFLRPYFLVSSRYENTDDNQVMGAELTCKGTVLKTFHFNVSLTYQDLRRKNVDIKSRLLQDARQPNIPYFFGNLSLRYEPDKLLGMSGWQFYGNYGYVEKYLLNAVPKAQEPPLFGQVDGLSGASIIPTQNLVDLGMTHKVSGTPIWLNAEVNNVLDAKAFDGFRVQKPGLHYRFKIKCSIN